MQEPPAIGCGLWGVADKKKARQTDTVGKTLVNKSFVHCVYLALCVDSVPGTESGVSIFLPGSLGDAWDHAIVCKFTEANT